MSSPSRRPPPPLLDRTDVALMATLTALGIGLRCWWMSGYGLGDDVIIRHATAWFLDSGFPPGANYAYRFTWWVPTAVVAAAFGVGEVAMVLPVLLAAAAAIPLTYAFGAALWGRTGGVLAASLLVTMPLDFAWSTMVTPDIIASTLTLACMLAIVRAPACETARARRRLLGIAAAMAWLAFHAKISVALMGIPILATFWIHRATLGRDLVAFFGVAAVLFGMTAFTSFALTGDPLFAYNSEIDAQGLRGEIAVIWHRFTWHVFMHFPNAVFATDQYGNVLFGGYSHLLIALALGLRLAGIRLGAPEVWWWLVVLALGFQFNIQRAEGEWVAGFRNVRHLHGLVHPLVLLLAGCLVQLRGRTPAVFGGLTAVALVFGFWHSVRTATLTHVSFADRRAACRVLVGLPPKPIYTDFQIETGCAIVPGGVDLKVQTSTSLPGPARDAEIAALGDVYVVTGGGREPHYGCIDCVPLARELDPDEWQLLFEGPPGPPPITWRPERLRIWERHPREAP